MPEGNWTIQPFRSFGGWRWKLTNRAGALVMTSPITYPSEAGARLAAENEVNELRQAILVP